MKKEKILIVGGAGYVGGYLSDVLNEEYDVTVMDILLYEERYLKNIKFIKYDITNYESLSDIINEYDIIIWLAAIVGDGACEVNKELSHTVNTKSVKWLVDNYKGKIIFTSTCSVYGINHELIDETAQTMPLSTYAKTKLEAEQYIVDNHKDYLIFRLGTLYGVGDEHSRIRLDLVANALSLNATTGKKLSVFGGEQWRPLLHVKDVSSAIKHCINLNISGLYNLSSQNFTIKNIADTIKKIIPKTEVEYVSIKFEDMRNYMVKNEKILKTGWTPLWSLDDGIGEIHKIISENRIKNPNDFVYRNHSFLLKNLK